MRSYLLLEPLIWLITFGYPLNCLAKEPIEPHLMTHNFVLSNNDKFASHLVSTSHHSQQTEIVGQLYIGDDNDKKGYLKQRRLSAGEAYYFIRAQNLDLSSLRAGQILTGPIVQSKIGTYDTSQLVVKTATFKIQKILLNIENPFFKDQ